MFNWQTTAPNQLTGIIFNFNGATWHAPLSEYFVCRGDIKALDDPAQVYANLPETAFALVHSEESKTGVITISGTTVMVTLQAKAPPEPVIGVMIKDQRGLDVLQGIIAERRLQLGSQPDPM